MYDGPRCCPRLVHKEIFLDPPQPVLVSCMRHRTARESIYPLPVLVPRAFVLSAGASFNPRARVSLCATLNTNHRGLLRTKCSINDADAWHTKQQQHLPPSVA